MQKYIAYETTRAIQKCIARDNLLNIKAIHLEINNNSSVIQNSITDTIMYHTWIDEFCEFWGRVPRLIWSIHTYSIYVLL